jgi:AraC-like DNA-binding protein
MSARQDLCAQHTPNPVGTNFQAGTASCTSGEPAVGVPEVSSAAMADIPVVGPDERIYLLNKVAAMANYLLRHGIATDLLLEDSVIENSALRDARARVSRRQLFSVIRNFIHLAPRGQSALDAGAALHISNYGFYGYALLSSSAFREAVEFAIDYRQLAAPTIDMRIVVTGKDAVWEFAPLLDMSEDLAVRRFTYDFQSAIHLALHRSILGTEFCFLSIDLPFPAPDYADYYESIFTCPIHFCAPVGRMRFLSEWLDRPPVGSDPITHSMVKDVCDELLAKIGESGSTAGEVYRRLIRQPGTFPGLEQMAGQLRIGSRTLRRRLRTEGKTYQQVVDEIRLQLAIKYLTDTDLTHEHIAVRLQFSDAANFRRAFRRWTGKGPGHVRAASRRGLS